nr:DUF2993 domain-containing protein [Corynebacterium aquatimens]
MIDRERAARRWWRRPPRAAWITASTIIVVLACLFLADSFTAARVERTLSRNAQTTAKLAAEPETFVDGFPFTQVLLTGQVPRLSIQALDVDVPGVGIANARTDIHHIFIDPADALAGRFEGAQADIVEHTISLDGVAFGQLIRVDGVHMTDLDISNPYDISPNGGPASEAQLTGTIPGMDTRSTAIVSLRLDGPLFRMTPIQLIDVDDKHREAVTRAFTLELDTRMLSFGAHADAADMVQLVGGSIQFLAQRRQVTLTSEDLSPIAHRPD